jgi:thiol:disulfide interchange protein
MKRSFLLILMVFMTAGKLFSQAKNTRDYNSLVRLAKKEKKIIILFFGADWCVPCKNLIAEVNAWSAKYKYLNNYSYYYYVDVDQLDSPEFLERFNVSTFPSTVMFNPKSGKFVIKKGSISLNNLDESVNKFIEISDYKK